MSMVEYEPTLREMVLEAANDVGGKLGTASRRVSGTILTGKRLVGRLIENFDQILSYAGIIRDDLPDILREGQTALYDSVVSTRHKAKEFGKGFTHDALEVLAVVYMIPSAHRLPALDSLHRWNRKKYVQRGYIESDRGNGNIY